MKLGSVIFVIIMAIVVFFIFATLSGCGYKDPMLNATEQLNALIREQKDCQQFMATYEQAKIKEPPTSRIKSRIEECKTIGAWK